jgi:PiT family inorganic phosphate transporter
MGRRMAGVRWSTARRIAYGWMLTLPAAAVIGAGAAAVALSGALGVVIVLSSSVVAGLGIYAVSRRAPVSSGTVNDSADVRLTPAGRSTRRADSTVADSVGGGRP